MAGKFYGAVGFGITAEDPEANGVWIDTITERKLYGDVIRNTRRFVDGQGASTDLKVTNSISVVVDEFAGEHFFAIKYVEWAGVRWTVDSVQEAHPRLILNLGEVYRGPTP